jgi:hypothetical protein
LPVEAMHAHFTSHVYHRHSHESYSFGVTETGAQAFTCRRGRHVSGPGMVMAFNPDDPHDGHAATGGGFTYRSGTPPGASRRRARWGRGPIQAGFADQAHLTRWFRRYYGITPGAYRSAVRPQAGTDER